MSRFQVGDEGGDGRVELADQGVLLEDPAVVDVPAGAVEEIQVVRDLDDPDAPLDQPARQQAALAELAAVEEAEVGRFLVEVEAPGERRAAQLQALVDGGVVVAQSRIIDGGLTGPEGGEEG